MASHKQVFRLRETTTFRRLEFLLDSGPQKRSSRARETKHPLLEKCEKVNVTPMAPADSFRTPETPADCKPATLVRWQS